MAGAEVDLTGMPRPSSPIDVTAHVLMGGLAVRVPSDWRVWWRFRGVGGIGTDGAVARTHDEHAADLRIRATALFGGVGIEAPRLIAQQKPGVPCQAISAARDVVPQDGALDQPVGAVVGVVDDASVGVVEPERRQVLQEVVLVRHGHPDLGDVRELLQHRLAHRVQRLLQGEGVRDGEGLEQRRPDAGVAGVEVQVGASCTASGR